MAVSNRVALVTGASRGLGAVIAKRLAADGFAVAVNHRSSPDAAEQIASSIVEAGGTAEVFAADVTDEQGVTGMVGRIEQSFGSLDVIVANATGSQPSIDITDLSWDAVSEQLAYFVKSPTLLFHAALPGMKQRTYGRFIHIGSEVVDIVPVGSSAYVCAKTAQLGLARSWAKEVAAFGITVNTVSPGWIPVERHVGWDDSLYDTYKEGLPSNRMGVPADIANAVSFLCSESSEFITGTKLTVNGGNTLD